MKTGKGDLTSEVSDRYPQDYLKLWTLGTSDRAQYPDLAAWSPERWALCRPLTAIYPPEHSQLKPPTELWHLILSICIEKHSWYTFPAQTKYSDWERRISDTEVGNGDNSWKCQLYLKEKSLDKIDSLTLHSSSIKWFPVVFFRHSHLSNTWTH